eukprot:255451_1
MVTPTCIFSLLISVLQIVNAKDPAPGWLSYALAKNPKGNDSAPEPITFIEAHWINLNVAPVPGNAKSCFYSPWIGIETNDNLTRIQAVNPWTGNDWLLYNQYFQWKPTHFETSEYHIARPGDIIYTSMKFNPENQTYSIHHADKTSGWSVDTIYPVQKQSNGQYKVYSMAYFVFEKVCQKCQDYPANNNLTFSNITVEWGGHKMVPRMTLGFVDNFCKFRAHHVDKQTIQMTWISKN